MNPGEITIPTADMTSREIQILWTVADLHDAAVALSGAYPVSGDAITLYRAGYSQDPDDYIY